MAETPEQETARLDQPDSLSYAAPPADPDSPAHRAYAAAEKFDVNKLTLGEISAVEIAAGVGIGSLGDKTQPMGLLLAGLAWVIKKRDNPKYTFAIAQTLTLGEVTAIIGDDDDADAGARPPADP